MPMAGPTWPESPVSQLDPLIDIFWPQNYTITHSIFLTKENFVGP